MKRYDMPNILRLILGCAFILLILSGCEQRYASVITEDEYVQQEETLQTDAPYTEEEYQASLAKEAENGDPAFVAELEYNEKIKDPTYTGDEVETVVQEPVDEAEVTDAREASNFESSKGYINTNVKTSLTGTVYSANGTKVFSKGAMITDVSKFTSPQINSDMANTFFISDLSSSKEGNDTAIFIIGLVFKGRTVNYNDTSEYYKQMVNVGAPCTVLLKHMVKANKTYQLKVQQHAGIFTAKHYSTDFNEFSQESTGDVLLDFIAPSILPHMTISPDAKTIYFTTGVPREDNGFYMLSHIQLTRISTNHNIDDFKYMYYPLIDYEQKFADEGYHKVDIHMFYMKIQNDGKRDDGTLFLASIGQPDSEIATGFLFNLDTLEDAGRGMRWRNREEVMSMVTN